ncbi:hypothetical protein EJB05_26635, partial [Eragrostis curvula]
MAASSSYQPLPTQSPPRVPIWDISNLLKTFQRYYVGLPAAMVIKSISNKINKLRDEVLWPQTHELIQGSNRFSQAVGASVVGHDYQISGRFGAPHVFIICNYWAINIARISQMVVHTMQDFASNVLHIWERQRSEWKQAMLAEKDI